MNYIVGNWKSHKRLAEVFGWLEGFHQRGRVDEEVKVVVCPSEVYVLDMYDFIQTNLQRRLELGVQDISGYPMGAYTGATAAEMVADYASYAIVGHSERRRYFGETSTMVRQKAERAVAAGLHPIVCVDEPYLEEQLRALDESVVSEMLVAYEPVAAIGSGTSDTPEHAVEVAARIRTFCGARVPVLYGGSATAENAGFFLVQPGLNGVLVGGASLDVESFIEIVRLAGVE